MSALILALLVAQDEKLSGPRPGEKAAPFVVFDVAARKDVDVAADGPLLIVFIHELSRPAAALMRALDETGQIKRVRGLRTLFVSLAQDRDGAERHLPNVVKSLNLKSPLGISVDGPEGPGAYGLNRDVALTILVARDGRVAANFAIVQPNETDAPRIREAVDAVLKTAAPAPAGTPDELKAEIVRLREEVLALREQVEAFKIRAERPAPGPSMRQAGAEDPALVNHCRRLIQMKASQEDLDAAVKDIEAYIEGKPELKKQYAAVLERVLKLEYGNDLGKAVMKAQLEKHKP
ncbi:MAG TPA: hypothetical protein VF950_28200 [Planctomycetota bacterium]